MHTPAIPPSASIRRLGPHDLPGVGRHLLALGPADRQTRFQTCLSDEAIAAYVGRINPDRAVLVGAAHGPGGRLLGLAEAHPTGAPGAVELAVSVHPSCRGRGLGRSLLAYAMLLAFGAGAETAELFFDPGNLALIRLAAPLGARFDTVRGHAVIGRQSASPVAAARPWEMHPVPVRGPRRGALGAVPDMVLTA